MVKNPTFLILYYLPNILQIPAEVFPTQYRGTCHGLSAAAGKVGSILAQIFLAYVKFGGKGVSDDRSTWLGWILVMYATPIPKSQTTS
jgi:hypothetical protein